MYSYLNYSVFILLHIEHTAILNTKLDMYVGLKTNEGEYKTKISLLKKMRNYLVYIILTLHRILDCNFSYNFFSKHKY